MPYDAGGLWYDALGALSDTNAFSNATGRGLYDMMQGLGDMTQRGL